MILSLIRVVDGVAGIGSMAAGRGGRCAQLPLAIGQWCQARTRHEMGWRPWFLAARCWVLTAVARGSGSYRRDYERYRARA
jgi:hypothetical protein